MSVIPMTEDTHVMVLTGAGISAESGIPTFRAVGGLWHEHAIEKVASPNGFREDPMLVWKFYSERRAQMGNSVPNEGHFALARLEARLGPRFLLATQNIDGLHQAAGNQRVEELHGNLFTSRCSVCDRPPFEDREVYLGTTVPGCGRCAARGTTSLLRPHIVWFGEALDASRLQRIDAFMESARNHPFVFLAVGTSGVVRPASTFVRFARERCGADTWLVNADKPDNLSEFAHFEQGAAGTILPTLFEIPK